MFEQEIRWSAGALALVVGVFLLTFVPVLVATSYFAKRGHSLTPILVTEAIIAAAVLGLMVVFMTLRIEIATDTLTVGFGPFKDRVPLERIVRCGTTSYNWRDWGGFGIRYSGDGKLYNVMGDHGQAVELVMSGGKRLLFSSPDPPAVCRALHERMPHLR
jgi:hypothetical protein